METQFWWFLDVISVLLLIISIYSYARKGFLKIVLSLAVSVVSIAAAALISAPISDSIYESTVKEKNIEKIEELLDENSFSRKTQNLLDGLGYKGITDNQKIEEIMASDEKAGEGVNDIINGLLSEKLSLFIPGESMSFISSLTGGEDDSEKEDSEKDDNSLFMLLMSDNHSEAASYIEENYTGAVSRNIIRLICFIILVFAIRLALGFVLKLVFKAAGIIPGFRLADSLNHTLGGVIGAGKGLLILFVAASVIRILIAVSSDEMMFFNTDVIDKTVFFKYIYELSAKL